MSHVIALDAREPLSYRHGLRQPAQTLRLRLGPLPATVDWPGVDAWLARRLDVAPADCVMPLADVPGDVSGDVPALFWRVLMTGAQLLRFGGIPVFEPGRLLALAADPQAPSHWLGEVAVAQIDYLPAETTTRAFEAAAIVVLGLIATPADFADAEPLYRQLDTALIAPLRAGSTSTPSTLALLQAAWQQDIPFRHEGNGIYRLGWGRRSRLFHGARSAGDSALAGEVAGNKLLTAQWLRRAGLPAPQHQLARTAAEALTAAQALGWPVVLKPLARDRGEGVSVDIADAPALNAAYAHAAAYGAEVLVERQVAGHCHRLLVVRGQVLYAVKRLPVAVQGDGRRTAAELIAAANAGQRELALWRRAPPLPADALAQACLRAAGLALDTVVPNGVWAPLRRIESTADGGRDEDCFARLHPDNIVLAQRAAAVMGLELAGVDIISPDIGESWQTNGAIVNEVNAAPVLGASQMSLDAMPALLARLIEDDGRIPVEVFTGGEEASERGRARQRELVAAGLACYLTGDRFSLDAQGRTLALALSGSFLRARALLVDPAVEALIVVHAPGAWDASGSPVDRLRLR